MEEILIATRTVRDLELRLGIEHTWTEDNPCYVEASQYLRRREFHNALDRVQQLVVQRLFELSKANIAGMGTSPLIFTGINLFNDYFSRL